jgi:hypothetical protein
MSLLDAESFADIDSTFVSVPELQAANTEMPKIKESFLITKVLIFEIVVPIKLGKELHKQFFVFGKRYKIRKAPTGLWRP